MSSKVFTLAELAELTQSKLVGNPSHQIFNVSDLDSATSEDASFLNKLPFGQTNRYEQAMRKTTAGVIFIHPEMTLTEGRNYLLNEDPSRAFQVTLEAFNGASPELTGFVGIHPTAILHPTCKIGNGVQIGPYAVIDKEVKIGDRTIVSSHCYVGPFTVIGEDCLLHPHVTLREKCILGNRVILQPGAVIGSCGFGYTTDKQGRHAKLNQVGAVHIEDDVEIGANTTIDRSRFKMTVVRRGTKIDNLVQIGHGAKIGTDNMIVAQTGIAGSAETGRHVVLAGQCGVAGHIKLGDQVIVTAKAGVDKSLPEAGKYGGSPAIPLGEHHRTHVYLKNIEKYIEQIKALSARLSLIEEKLN